MMLFSCQVLEFDASDDRGIGVVRDRSFFHTTLPLIGVQRHDFLKDRRYIHVTCAI